MHGSLVAMRRRTAIEVFRLQPGGQGSSGVPTSNKAAVARTGRLTVYGSISALTLGWRQGALFEDCAPPFDRYPFALARNGRPASGDCLQRRADAPRTAH